MSSGAFEVLGRVERRRRFTTEEKLAVLREASAPDVNVSAVARRHGLTPSQVFKWRRLAVLGVIGIPGASELPSFMAVQVAAERGPQETGCRSAPVATAASAGMAGETRPAPPGGIVIELACGRRVQVDRHVDAAALRRVLDFLEGR